MGAEAEHRGGSVRALNISDYLSHGQQSAITLRQLQTLTNLDGRTIRRMIERERRDGVPILSDNQTGYFLAENDDERDTFVKSMLHRANEIRLTAAAIEKGVKT